MVVPSAGTGNKGLEPTRTPPDEPSGGQPMAADDGPQAGNG